MTRVQSSSACGVAVFSTFTLVTPPSLPTQMRKSPHSTTPGRLSGPGSDGRNRGSFTSVMRWPLATASGTVTGWACGAGSATASGSPAGASGCSSGGVRSVPAAGRSFNKPWLSGCAVSVVLGGSGLSTLGFGLGGSGGATASRGGGGTARPPGKVTKTEGGGTSSTRQTAYVVAPTRSAPCRPSDSTTVTRRHGLDRASSRRWLTKASNTTARSFPLAVFQLGQFAVSIGALPAATQ